MVRTLVWLLFFVRAAAAVGPACDQATDLCCAPTGATVAGRVATYVNITGDLDNTCTATCAAGTVTGTFSGNATTASALAANGTNCAAASFPLGVDAAGNAESCSTSISGNAATATALAGNGTNCAAASFPLGVDASGNAESCSTSISGNAGTATALDHNPSACAATKFVTDVDAGVVLACTQPNFTDLAGAATDAQVPDTITLTNLTQVGTRSHSDLQNLSADDHAQYALLAGRAAGQTLSGDTGTATTDDLKLQPSSTTNYLGFIGLCSGQGTPAGSSGVHYPCVSLWPDGLTIGTAGVGFDFPAIKSGATFTHTAATLASTYLFDVEHTNDQTATCNVVGGDLGLYFAPIEKNSSANASTIGSVFGLQSAPWVSNTGAGTMVANNVGAIYGALGTISAGSTVTDAWVGGNASNDGTNSGTITRQWGWHAGALTLGTAAFQFGATEHAIKGTVPASEGVFGVESGAPNRFYFKNESGHIWRMGYTSWTGTYGALAADNTARYAQPYGTAVAWDTTENNVDTFIAPGPLHIYALACGLNVAPDNGAGSQTRTFTVRIGAIGALADTTVACTITETATACNGRTEAGVAATTGQAITVKSTATNTPAATTANQLTCAIWWNLDAF
jgi:hypothetical protein